MRNISWDRVKKIDPLFIVTVIIPTAIAIIYYGLIASDIYVSESRFVVRSTGKQSLPEMTGLSSLLKGSEANSELYAVKDFTQSRDALRLLDRDGALKRAFTRDNIDVFDRFGTFHFDPTFEDLFSYYGTHIKVEQDSAASITTLKVRAYTPQDSLLLNERLLQLSEGLVNRLNRRSQSDMIRFATDEVSEARERASQAALALSAYRNNRSVIDPEKQAVAQLQLTTGLREQIIGVRAQLAQLRSTAPNSPLVKVLSARVARLESELGGQVQQIAGSRSSLAGTAVGYQRLYLDSQFADKLLASAMASLEQARNEAARKQVYVERIVQPNLPDDAIEPRRLRSVGAVLVLGLVAWAILTMLLAGLREHKD